MMRSLITRLFTPTTLPILQRSVSQVASKTPLTLRPLSIFSKKTVIGPIMQASARFAHDAKPKGDDELINFLSEEIATEKKGLRGGSVPRSLEGFEVKLNKSEVTLTKKFGSETISISLNVNHTVDADFSEDANQRGEKDAAEMKSRPNFEIEIEKGKQILSFSCSYAQDAAAPTDPQEEYQDAFVIDEISLFEGEYNDEVYAVAGDILDGYLYDLFMNMLEERGISNEFVDKMSEVCTDYEHQLYIDMLGNLQKFLSSK